VGIASGFRGALRRCSLRQYFHWTPLLTTTVATSVRVLLPLQFLRAPGIALAHLHVCAGWRSMRSASGVSPGMAQAYVIREVAALYLNRLRFSRTLPEDRCRFSGLCTDPEGAGLCHYAQVPSDASRPRNRRANQSDFAGGAIVDGQRSTAHETCSPLTQQVSRGPAPRVESQKNVVAVPRRHSTDPRTGGTTCRLTSAAWPD